MPAVITKLMIPAALLSLHSEGGSILARIYLDGNPTTEREAMGKAHLELRSEHLALAGLVDHPYIPPYTTLDNHGTLVNIFGYIIIMYHRQRYARNVSHKPQC